MLQSVLMVVVMTLLLGVAYPFAITGFAALVFPGEATGTMPEATTDTTATSASGASNG
jgi:K+-transporting ATPase c subunit